MDFTNREHSISAWAVPEEDSSFVFDAEHSQDRPEGDGAANPVPEGSISSEDEGRGGRMNGEDLKVMRRRLRGTKIYFASMLRDVVMANARELGWASTRNEAAADVLWVETPMSAAQVKAMLPHQRVNSFPGLKQHCHKVEFARHINRMESLFPGEFAFCPRTYVMPYDQGLLAADFESVGKKQSGTWIVKPDDACGGAGIFLTDDVLGSTGSYSRCVVQEYIPNPLLLGDLKFDLRLYVVVTSFSPVVKAYVHRGGMARLAVEPYEPPSSKNFHKLNMHLTNYSLNKFSNNFVPADFHDDTESTKRTLGTAFDQLREQYGNEFDADSVWGKVDDLVMKSLCALQPSMQVILQTCGDNAQNCFQVLGFDVMLDSNMQPHLLEVNSHPSLQTDAPIDTNIKTAVILPLLQLVAYEAKMLRLKSKHDKRFPPQKVDEELARVRSRTKLNPGPNATVSSFVPSITRDEWESQHCGHNLCLATSDDHALYVQFIEPFGALQKIFVQFCGCNAIAASDGSLGLTGTKFNRFARSCDILVPHEVDLVFLKRTRATGSNTLSFFDFVTILMVDIAPKLGFTQTTTLGTLQKVVAYLQSRR